MNTPNFNNACQVIISTAEITPLEIHGNNNKIVIQMTKDGLQVCSDGYLIQLPNKVATALHQYFKDNFKEE